MASLLLTPLPGAAMPTLCSEIIIQACQSQLPQALAVDFHTGLGLPCVLKEVRG